MQPVDRHRTAPEVSFDGGDMDCGSGLLLHIRRHLDPLRRGGLLEILSTETSVDEDLPAWCRLTGNELVSWTKVGRQRSFLICKGTLAERTADEGGAAARPVIRVTDAPPVAVTPLAKPAAAPPIAPLSVLTVGSWPRPRWMLDAVHARMEGRLSEAEFEATADDAVRLAVASQIAGGADVMTDGEQRRDSYANFVGGRLENCQLIPLVDLLPLVDDPEKLRREFEALDVPAGEVRHPAVFGPLRRTRPLARHELDFLRTLTEGPVKVALPGPMPVVRRWRKTSCACFAKSCSTSSPAEPELAFARDLNNRVVEGAPRDRVALHICRGNWTPDESAALRGDYRPLLPLLQSLDVGTFLLELCTPRAGELEVLRDLPESCRIGVGVVNQKRPDVEPVAEIRARIEHAISLFGRDRVLIQPDCGFATFADNPVASAAAAQAKIAAMVEAVGALR